MMGGLSFICRSGEVGRTYNRPEDMFWERQTQLDMSGKYGTSNAGAESVGVSDCNKVYKEAGNEAVMSISVDDCIDLDGKERSILAKVKDLSVISELLKHMSSEGFDDVGLRYVGGRWVWLEFDLYGSVERVKDFKAPSGGSAIGIMAPEVYKEVGWSDEEARVLPDMVIDGPMVSWEGLVSFTESLHRCIESFIVFIS
ncbi:hypothetical protein Tco_0987441 [Tanacetum coccineum]|uniref:Uncharacterized protein n=1 Tax=Tanacetum coccineum TaxID=301880 RepID=A0ABQ5J0N1_9ASTR